MSENTYSIIKSNIINSGKTYN